MRWSYSMLTGLGSTRFEMFSISLLWWLESYIDVQLSWNIHPIQLFTLSIAADVQLSVRQNFWVVSKIFEFLCKRPNCVEISTDVTFLSIHDSKGMIIYGTIIPSIIGNSDKSLLFHQHQIHSNIEKILKTTFFSGGLEEEFSEMIAQKRKWIFTINKSISRLDLNCVDDAQLV